ncbi:CD1375 family protein [Paenibacillus marchantiae]
MKSLYIRLIQKSLISIEDVPEELRKDVQEELVNL